MVRPAPILQVVLLLRRPARLLVREAAFLPLPFLPSGSPNIVERLPKVFFRLNILDGTVLDFRKPATLTLAA